MGYSFLKRKTVPKIHFFTSVWFSFSNVLIKSLNIIPADKFPKATEHVSEMVDLIQKLLERGLAYKADDGVYFNVQKFRDYGKLANIDLESLKTGASGRVSADEYSKENVPRQPSTSVKWLT